MFEVKYLNDVQIEENLLYNSETNEFYSEPLIESDIVFLAAYLSIGFSSLTNQSTQIWGYHHKDMWKQKDLCFPEANLGKLILKKGLADGGDTIRLKQVENWETFYDKKKDIVYFGSTEHQNDIKYVKIFSRSIVGLDKGGEIQELWLQPEFVNHQ